MFGLSSLPVESFVIFGGLVVLDTVTGVIRSIILKGGKSFTSMKLTSGVVSKLLVILVPLVIAWAGNGSGINLLPLAKGALSMLVLAESYSIIGNIHAIRTRKDTVEFDAIAAILGFVKSNIEKYLRVSTKSDKD